MGPKGSHDKKNSQVVRYQITPLIIRSLFVQRIDAN